MNMQNLKNFFSRIILLFIFTGTALVFSAWWYVSPKGFPVTNPRFWTNSIIPVTVTIISLAAIPDVYRKKQSIIPIILPCWSCATLAFLVTSRILYPISMRPVFMVFLLFWFLIFCLLTWLILRKSKLSGLQLIPMFILVVLAILSGAFLPLSQRSWKPATKPLNPSGSFRTELPLNPSQSPLHLSDQVTVLPRLGNVLVYGESVHLKVSPLLFFYSRSPDRCWILCAPRAARRGPKVDYKGMRRIPEGLHLEYAYDGRNVLEVVAADQEKFVEIEAVCELPAVVYSHLNTYTEFTIHGKEKLFVSFSPCPDERIEIVSFEYPFGRPMRSAYLDPEGIFRVVQAKSADKGPFKTLAEGPLAADQPLELTLFDRDDAVCRIAFLDWAAQASTQLSPTAGWGLSENAIEFNLGQENPPKATFYITLAATSAGRGFDSVGHTPGTYRNRIQIDPLNK